MLLGVGSVHVWRGGGLVGGGGGIGGMYSWNGQYPPGLSHIRLYEAALAASARCPRRHLNQRHLGRQFDMPRLPLLMPPLRPLPRP